ncbi:hypothetical protein M758_8G011900 [Ceratodon purpureus]|uniref:Uncharacterized protein n=1 Tax=Ceratodon purpureus TaxID=3225 RepID=A0A8T0GWD3_CERPU|nr:hypothetical protein KC19_8G012500 [Ceratodon purpureus]KAG0607236.1 hypothetical protein M758_8G011900 [Ceratodon purpureus]
MYNVCAAGDEPIHRMLVKQCKCRVAVLSERWLPESVLTHLRANPSCEDRVSEALAPGRGDENFGRCFHVQACCGGTSEFLSCEDNAVVRQSRRYPVDPVWFMSFRVSVSRTIHDLTSEIFAKSVVEVLKGGTEVDVRPQQCQVELFMW